MLNLKCMVPRFPENPYKYRAILIEFVPAVQPYKQYQHAAGDKHGLQYSVDALVMLLEMNKGRMIQVPTFWVEIVDEFPSEENNYEYPAD